MVVLTNKILFLILLKFILQNKVLNQSLTVEPPRPNNDEHSFQSELSKNLKKRLSDLGSLNPQKSEETHSPNPKTEDSFVENGFRPRQIPTMSRDPTLDNILFQGQYQPTPKSDFSSTNFEEFFSKQKMESLEKCTKVPHDFVLVVDESGSISSYNWGTVVKDFVNLITSAIAQLNGENNFSIVQYSHKPMMIMEPRRLNKTTLDGALKVVKRMFEAKRTYGTTYTGAALEFVRDQILDPTDKFVLELSENARPLGKKNMIVILMTDGAANDHKKALKESLIQRFNGVDLFIFGIGSVNEAECRKFVGCPSTGECTNFLHAEWNTVLDYLYKLISSICRDTGRNATCLETWSKFSECSVPCGGGTRKSTLEKLTTLTEPTTGLDGRRGMSCEEQYRNITERTEVCNMFPCRDNLVNINKHTPSADKVPKRLIDLVYTRHKQEEPPKDDEERDTDEEDETKEEEDDDSEGDVVNDTPEEGKELPSQPQNPTPLTTLGNRESEPKEETKEEPEEGEDQETKSEPKNPDLTENTSQLSRVLKTLENTGTTDQDLTKNTVTTEPEVKQRTMPKLERLHTEERPRDPVERLNTESRVGDALRELVDQGPEISSPPFQLLGGSDHPNLHVDHVLNDKEVEEMEKRKKNLEPKEELVQPLIREETHTMRKPETESEPLPKSTRLTETRSEPRTRLTDSETQTLREEPRTREEKSTETDRFSTPKPRLTDSETQTIREEPRTKREKSTETDRAAEPKPVEKRESSTQTKPQESLQRHSQTTNMAHDARHTVPTHGQRHNTRHMPEELPSLPTHKLENVGTLTKNFKQKFREFFHNEKVKKLSAVAIVIFLTAISISVFSYTFLREKEPTQHLFDPSDQEFMNAGDGDDVEPSENYQVSNMEDGIWA